MKKLVTALCLMVSPLTFAAQTNQAVSAGIGFDQLNYALSYRYEFTEQWEIELGYMNQDVFLTDVTHSGTQVEDVHSFSTAMLYNIPLSQRNRLIFKLGAAKYNINAIGYSSDITSDSEGVHLIAGLGWRYEFDSGLETSIAYTYQDVDFINKITMALNLGYRF
jgi:hypothetical protein